MKKIRGFTVVELLIVVVVIGILATIVIVAYNGVQNESKQSKIAADLSNVQKLVELYKIQNGSYPATATNLNPDWGTNTARTDANCSVGTHQADWVPGLSSALPQSPGGVTGLGGWPGCYLYASDGTSYIISAWNMLPSPQSTTKMYRRLGFREMDPSHAYAMFYICNHVNVGGDATGTYNIYADYYKYSLTLTNITSCNETPPAGA